MPKKNLWRDGLVSSLLLAAFAIVLLVMIMISIRTTDPRRVFTPTSAISKSSFSMEVQLIPVDGKLKIVGVTDLIEVGEETIVTLRSPPGCGYILGILTCQYLDEVKPKIASGKFETDAFFSDNVGHLPPGVYDAELTYIHHDLHLRYEAATRFAMPLEQPQIVQITLDNNIWCRYSSTEEC